MCKENRNYLLKIFFFNEMVNFCIVHFNTPKLTECLIRSINKFTPDCKIYIFDNSDKSPFVYRQDNIVYFDNTKGQIINFEQWLNGYPKQQGQCYSAKHCYTIQKCIEIINEPFILLDSDVLLKRDVSILYDKAKAFIGHFGTTRIYPFICFINVPLLKKYDVAYFDEKNMMGIVPGANNDTGNTLYRAKDKVPCANIEFRDFVEHYGGGSYSADVFKRYHKGQLSQDEWLKVHKSLWDDSPVGEQVPIHIEPYVGQVEKDVLVKKPKVSSKLKSVERHTHVRINRLWL